MTRCWLGILYTHWLTGNPLRFKAYVGNHVLDQISPGNILNPVDCASRGLFSLQLKVVKWPSIPWSRSSSRNHLHSLKSYLYKKGRDVVWLLSQKSSPCRRLFKYSMFQLRPSQDVDSFHPQSLFFSHWQTSYSSPHDEWIEQGICNCQYWQLRSANPTPIT